MIGHLIFFLHFKLYKGFYEIIEKIQTLQILQYRILVKTNKKIEKKTRLYVNKS